jgi:hypothetical protein
MNYSSIKIIPEEDSQARVDTCFVFGVNTIVIKNLLIFREYTLIVIV